MGCITPRLWIPSRTRQYSWNREISRKKKKQYKPTAHLKKLILRPLIIHSCGVSSSQRILGSLTDSLWAQLTLVHKCLGAWCGSDSLSCKRAHRWEKLSLPSHGPLFRLVRIHAYACIQETFSFEWNHHAYLHYQIIFLCLPVDLTWTLALFGCFPHGKIEFVGPYGAILLELRFQGGFLKFHLLGFENSHFQNWT